tara:strand:- start:744 stop:1079 length:336 start_codon:yes stop_codon:yes gene_type:complete
MATWNSRQMDTYSPPPTTDQMDIANYNPNQYNGGNHCANNIIPFGIDINMNDMIRDLTNNYKCKFPNSNTTTTKTYKSGGGIRKKLNKKKRKTKQNKNKNKNKTKKRKTTR